MRVLMGHGKLDGAVANFGRFAEVVVWIGAADGGLVREPGTVVPGRRVDRDLVGFG
jgi:hypothetical protein